MLLMVMIYQGKNSADHHHLKNQRSALRNLDRFYNCKYTISFSLFTFAFSPLSFSLL